MTNPLERGLRSPESPPIVTCPYCGGKKTVTENGKTVPCRPCNGTGGVRDR